MRTPCVCCCQSKHLYTGSSRCTSELGLLQQLWNRVPMHGLCPSKCSRSMPQHAAACRGTLVLELHMGVLKHAAACRSMLQHPFFCVHVPVCLAVFFVR